MARPVIDFPDPSAQVNALLSGQLDAITDIPFAQISVVKAHNNLAVLESQGGGWLPLCMAIDMEPFTDVRVRQAFRLIANRDQILQQVLSGHGRIANVERVRIQPRPIVPGFCNRLAQRLGAPPHDRHAPAAPGQ